MVRNKKKKSFPVNAATSNLKLSKNHPLLKCEQRAAVRVQIMTNCRLKEYRDQLRLMQPGSIEADELANSINISSQTFKKLARLTQLSAEDLPNSKEDYNKILLEAGIETEEYQKKHSLHDVIGIMAKVANTPDSHMDIDQPVKNPRTPDAEGFIPPSRHLTAQPNIEQETERPIEAKKKSIRCIRNNRIRKLP
ncbi:hypothetical protein CEXT_482801 [Caerostris extrusa]|uniref:Uncharacterized protein n=1 Tax=Caerostris extrusa TaxID=172846 RepID=A0AAV4VTC3_CAEEX|nr:hypothetical protein CEXT_482801 [Caerostris extrusa]